jgi:hypothetical protein
MLQIQDNQKKRAALLQEISKAEYIQKNRDLWNQHEKVMRLIDRIWKDETLWSMSITDIEKKCQDSHKIMKDCEKELFEIDVNREMKMKDFDEKLKQNERNQKRLCDITVEEKKLESLEMEYDNFQKKIQKESIALAATKDAEMQWTQSVQEYEEKKKKIKSEKQMLKLLDKDGLPLHMLKEKVKQMEIQLNELITPFLDRRIQFFIDEKNIEFGTVFKDKPICHYFGGMESFILDLSLKLTFSKFSILPRPNFFIIDERISVLDQQRLYNISFLFQFISNLTTNVLLISHIPQVKDFVDKSIEVVKVNEKSHIQYVS